MEDKIAKLSNLLSKQSQRAVENEAKNNEHLRKSILSNKFGSILTSSGDLVKGEKHFLAGIEMIEQSPKKIAFSNIYLNLGNLYGQKRNYDQAVSYYLKAIETSPHNNNNNNLTNREYDAYEFDESLNSINAYLDAFTNIAVMYVNNGEKEKAFEYCLKAIEINPNNREAIVNFGDILRQLGRQKEAIDITWTHIEKYTNKQENTQYSRPKQIQITNISLHDQQQKSQQSSLQTNSDCVNILCVKWGTRYNAEYVNKLYRGVKKHTTKQFKFYCFTEDGNGLDENIQVKQLVTDWQRWWGKASLFSSEHNLAGNVNIYIDLDMVITGNIDNLLEYQGQFAILNTLDIACEKDHSCGYNSSVMIWDNNFSELESIYTSLKHNYNNITQYIVRFDYWLEMIVENADFIQQLFPMQVADFLSYCQTSLPKEARIVAFPRKPKPEDYPAEWIKEHWI